MLEPLRQARVRHLGQHVVRRDRQGKPVSAPTTAYSVCPCGFGKARSLSPPASAAANLSLVVPRWPTRHAGLARLARRGPHPARASAGVGGTKITIPGVGPDGAIRQCHRGPPARPVARSSASRTRFAAPAGSLLSGPTDLARRNTPKVAKVEGELEEEDKRLPDSGARLEEARRRIQLSANHRPATATSSRRTRRPSAPCGPLPQSSCGRSGWRRPRSWTRQSPARMR